MGVPAFYRWLSSKYPMIITDIVEKRNEDGSVQASLREPIDNLYIDMNGIIHPCCHPEDENEPATEDEMFQRTFSYMDRIISLVNPTNLLYLAVDGVAPRAKMNQQRARRYKTAAEFDQEDQVYVELCEKFLSEKRPVPPRKVHWDSNVITPGTEFLTRMSKALYYYVNERFESNVLSPNLKVIISDANCPGEGEHKIMHYIRAQRTFENYNVNMRHCIHGADADLIMLGLVTHEPHFYILRESVVDKNSVPSCFICGQKNHLAVDCPFTTNPTPVETKDTPQETNYKASWKPLQLLSIAILREYLFYEFQFQNSTTFRPNLERCIDDFVLMCFLVGNDFLPHLPSLSIHKGSIDQMLLLYEQIRPTLTNYLTEDGKINVEQLELFLKYLGNVEKDVFIADLKFKERSQNGRHDTRSSNHKQHRNEIETIDSNMLIFQEMKRFKTSQEQKTKQFSCETQIIKPTHLSHVENIDLFKTLMRDKIKSNNETDAIDTVKLGSGTEEKYKLRYYEQKFHVKSYSLHDLAYFIERVANSYVEGLRWVLQYYYNGIYSWEWFYPYHYAPLASDICAFGFKKQKPFYMGKPFKPIEQLMAVLPPRSKNCLPKEYANLMTSEKSPLADFYPTKFMEDPDGKRFKWQWVVLLPFIDQKRLLQALTSLQATLTEEEQKRNSEKQDCLIFAKTNTFLPPSLQEQFAHLSSEQKTFTLTYKAFPGLGGNVTACSINSIQNNHIQISGCSKYVFPPKLSQISYFNIQYTPLSTHVCSLLPNAKPPLPTITKEHFTSLLDNPSSHRFNSQNAKRMIIGCLGRLGVLSKATVQNYHYSSTNTNNRSYNYISDNKYEREMFPKSSYNLPCKKKIVHNTHPAWTNPSTSFYRHEKNESFPHSSYQKDFPAFSMEKQLPFQQSYCYSLNHNLNQLNSSLTPQSVKHSYHSSRPPRILCRPSQMPFNSHSHQESHSSNAPFSFTSKNHLKSKVFKTPSQTLTTSSRPPWKKKN